MFKLKLNKFFRNLTFIFIDFSLIALGFVVAFSIRFGFVGASDYLSLNDRTIAVVLIFVLIKLGFLILSKQYQNMWRFFSFADSLKLAVSWLGSFLFITSIAYMFEGLRSFPRSIILSEVFISLFLLICFRGLVRFIYEAQNKKTKSSSAPNTLIVGAGLAGLGILKELNSSTDTQVIGFVDDDQFKQGKKILNLPVLGMSNDIASILNLNPHIKQVIVGVRDPGTDLVQRVSDQCRKLNIKLQLLNESCLVGGRIVDGSSQVLLRELELKDLLKRPSRVKLTTEVRKLYKDKRVVISGAGGSIGSELAKQVLSQEPDELILLEHSEFNLYKINKELGNLKGPNTKILPILLDLKDKNRLLRLFQKHKPQLVLHAAAYKHVHLVESNVSSSIINNVHGCMNLIEASVDVGIEKFVLISSDKAVNPSGIMGATKRICEILTSEAGLRSQQSNFSSVRFGNVLGSSGSLVPHLLEVIRDGGPIKVTHKEMERYFMLIEEAVSLVLASSVLAQPSEIQVLDMGESIKITDIAKALLGMLGLSEKDVPIIYTEPGQGEKLFEELYMTGSEIQTKHPDIFTVKSSFNDKNYFELKEKINNLVKMASLGDDEACHVEILNIVKASLPQFNSEASTLSF